MGTKMLYFITDLTSTRSDLGTLVEAPSAVEALALYATKFHVLPDDQLRVIRSDQVAVFKASVTTAFETEQFNPGQPEIGGEQ